MIVEGNDETAPDSKMAKSSKKFDLTAVVIFRTAETISVIPAKDHNTYHDSGATSDEFHSKYSFLAGSLIKS